MSHVNLPKSYTNSLNSHILQFLYSLWINSSTFMSSSIQRVSHCCGIYGFMLNPSKVQMLQDFFFITTFSFHTVTVSWGLLSTLLVSVCLSYDASALMFLSWFSLLFMYISYIKHLIVLDNYKINVPKPVRSYGSIICIWTLQNIFGNVLVFKMSLLEPNGRFFTEF